MDIAYVSFYGYIIYERVDVRILSRHSVPEKTVRTLGCSHDP